MMDRIREALFNILAHHDWGRPIGDVLKDTHVLDAFCGTGALALEALSRGAAFATLFDKDAQALRVAQHNAQQLGLTERCRISSADALQPPKAAQACRLIFLAPPYRKGLIPPALAALDQAGWIDRHALIMAETAKREELEIPAGFTSFSSRSYSDTMLHFFGR
jgi:16S rRNA (guanine966-N2)-methyltransferase